MRFTGLVFVLFSVTFITFILGYWGSLLGVSDPIRQMLGTHFDPVLYKSLSHEYGLDLPWYQQYFNFVVNALHGSFGLSYHYQEREAWDVLKDGMPFSIELGLESFALTLIIGIPAGIIAALKSNTYIDTAVSSTMLTLYALPDIALCVAFQVLMVILYQNHLPYLPVAGWDSWQSRIGPVLIVGTTGVGYFSRLTKISVLEVLGQDYIRTARSKGLIERIVINRHVLRNALLPLVTVIGPSLAFIVTGVFIIEQIFNIPGVSSITLDAIFQRDYPVVQATTVITCTVVVIFNVLTDIAYSIVDPRIRLQ